MVTKRIKEASQYNREKNIHQIFNFQSVTKVKILKKHDFDLEKILNPAKICVTNYGSDLKSVEELDNL